MTTIERFMDKVEAVTESGCWIWLGSRNSHGYGKFYLGSKSLGAHRFAYEHFIGPIPEGLVPDHLCRVRCCANPWHLDIVTHTENKLRGVGICAVNARKTTCKNGHHFTDDNTIYRSTGGRGCMACKKINSHAMYQRKANELKGK